MKNDKKVKSYERTHEEIAPVFKALSNPKRIRILLALREEKCRVGNLTDCVGESFPILSQQLAILKRHGVVERNKNNKKEVFYKIINSFADKVLDLIEENDITTVNKKR